MSPRLAPLGSPGPVTPLELDEREGYFFGGVKAALNEVKKEQGAEKSRMKEKEREREKQSKRKEQASRRPMSSMK